MTDQKKPPPDVGLLTPNDWRRVRAKLKGNGHPSPEEILQTGSLGEFENIHQLLVLAYKLRDDPAMTWERAGDIPAGDVLDLTVKEEEQEPPLPTALNGSPGHAAAISSVKKSSARQPLRTSGRTSARSSG